MSYTPQISIAAPLYNEEESLPLLVERLNAVMDNTSETIEVVLIDDGSSDKTAEMMKDLALNDKRYQCVFLTRNFGHQLALSAGLKYARATEAVFVVDGDLQDPPELLTDFYQKYREGYDVVYGIRKKRKEGLAKKLSYFFYYRLQKRISKINVPLDSGDFGLISRRVVDIINEMKEESRYIRGMRSWIGYKQIGLEYERRARVAGDSKYSWKKLFELAYNGIFNFSDIPLKFITKLGVYAVILALLYFAHAVYAKFVHNEAPPGFTGLLFTIILFGGVQLVSIGIIGEYVSRIFFQVKGRPLFLVKDYIKDQEVKQPKAIKND